MARALSGLTIGAALAALVSAGASAQDLPGRGKTVNFARATWDYGWFQAEIYRSALQRLGYSVDRPETLDNALFYQSVGQGDVDLWVNGWFPLHDTYGDAFEAGAERVGHVARNGALQGYLIDKKTADQNGITNLSDLKKPGIRSLFDNDGDGKAEMVACPPDWGCDAVIADHLDAWGLGDHIEPVTAAYSTSMTEAVRRLGNGQPILFYGWTPHWTLGALAPGRDVVWIETPAAGGTAAIADVEGCVNNPCRMGWDANDIRPVANSEFLTTNPAVRRLLETMSIPLGDILAQNARLNDGEGRQSDIERHASEWIAANQRKFDEWIKAAIDAAG